MGNNFSDINLTTLRSFPIHYLIRGNKKMLEQKTIYARRELLRKVNFEAKKNNRTPSQEISYILNLHYSKMMKGGIKNDNTKS